MWRKTLMSDFLKGFVKQAFPKQKALFLDLDGTVRTTKNGKPCPNKPEDQVVMEGRYDKIHDYKKRGYKIIAVTNQGGIGKGYMTEKDCKKILADLNERMGRPFDQMLYAPAAPGENHYWTKPNPGMIDHAARTFNIDLNKSVMVGDRASDKDAANNAGVKFEWAKDFFGDDK
jgi:D-glycero-D-manno-heptose 1,7-bisphosphate phosphatase